MTEEVSPTRDEQILKAKELYSQGSRNYLVKCYSESVDELSQVCALYEELYGEICDELGMPYLLYAKSLIALALDENKVIDVPDEEDDDEEDEEGETDTQDEESKLKGVKDQTDQTDDKNTVSEEQNKQEITANFTNKLREDESKSIDSKPPEESAVTSTEDIKENFSYSKENVARVELKDDGKPSTSNGVTDIEEEEENEAASNLQLAWEILELAAKIFSRQGISGLPNLAEVQTELANIEFENNILDSAREDYGKALLIYKELPDNYRRAMAEIHYKIGLTYLMQQMNPEGAESLKQACFLIEDEIKEMNRKKNLTEKEVETVKDMEETKQEIWAKISEIEETRQQNIAEVRAALDSFIAPSKEMNDGSSGPTSSAKSTPISSSSKPTNISHLIKRKKPETPLNSEAEVGPSPAKKTAK